MKVCRQDQAVVLSRRCHGALYALMFLLLMGVGVSTSSSQTYDPLSSESADTAGSDESKAQVATPPEVREVLGDAQLQGQERFRWFGFSVYDIRLWVKAPLNIEAWAGRLFALELTYARSLEGQAIAEKSLEEMQAQESIDAQRQASWLSFMQSAFPNVEEGDRLTGIYRPDGGAAFYFNGRETASTDDADFARLFFGIWLSPDTSEPALRRALFGMKE
ncbi:chalcone isomerase family protein [Neopusillimonas maritima]|uniref:Chalcone isomerase domain-containing protein n=1 Tax=Neopusillimonas maritima TaxID=2026239 RepID=A0A3A1YWR0_9BURK|nr:chalcone isomerase family protein [Neopusillimonas maritima]RIY41280.1 hypothetical protein CJP73_07045 [Neopusillimonas maritima]